MEEYPIYKVHFPNKSFSWANGFYALIETDDNKVKICHINTDTLTPQRFDSGKLMVGITHKNNLIYKTSLVLKI